MTTCQYVYPTGYRKGQRCDAPLGPKNVCGFCKMHSTAARKRYIPPQTEIVEARRFEVSG